LGKKKKKSTNTPQAKRMNRKRRLQSAAASWLKSYDGKSYMRGYRKHFGVNAETAIIELRLLGVELSEEAARKAREGEKEAARAKQLRKEKTLQRQREQQLGEAPWSDGTFAYIAGIRDGEFHMV
jgi:hypothetical protein